MPAPVLSRAFFAVFLTASPCFAAPDFVKEVLPILENRCIECHRAPYEENGRTKTPKGGVRLDAAWAILQGNENGKILEPGDAGKSQIYLVTTLPKDDDLFMPPKGDPMTASEQKLLKEWIDAGAKFGDWEGNLAGKPADAPSTAREEDKPRDHETFYAALAEGVKAAPSSVIRAAQADGAQIFTLKADSPLLRADFLTGVSACDDAKLEVLLPLRDQIAQLDLGRTAVTDAGMTTVAKLHKLASLDLRQTAVTDEGLRHLAKLENLRTLNLYGVKVSDAGLKHLVNLKQLRNVYLWGSKATEKGAKQLADSIPGLAVSVK
jgi:hypothetical protein